MPNSKNSGAPESKGVLPESGDYVKGPGGPTGGIGGEMPGGPEMEGWKPPLKEDAFQTKEDKDDEAQEQGEAFRRRVGN